MVLHEKTLPNIRGLVRFLHMIRLLLNLIFPNSKEQFIMLKGIKLLPMADFTLIFLDDGF